ncbi:hypothetical protein LSH36_32g01001 [Paralvinella palmiformis]|uniref:Uncharacterized protein n=1 Tax=Paralvinella palmiformis TaxID=53620 RepID=A0AAD9K8W4_9ANNE|nr:hypothetical protein LSH36_32g01001 [Paralvinella palmiformis]
MTKKKSGRSKPQTPKTKDGEKYKVSQMGYEETESIEEEEQQSTPKSLLSNFLLSTSSHGFAHMSRARGGAERSVWAVLTLAGIATATFQSYNVIEIYLRYEYNTLIDIKFDANVTFPVITLCNLNKYK